MPQFTMQEALSVIIEASQGFEQIFKEIGYFEISDTMIGFNLNR